MPNLTTTIEDYSPLLVYSGSDWTAGTSENDTSLDQYVSPSADLGAITYPDLDTRKAAT